MPFGKSLYAEGFTKKQGGIFVNNSSKNKKYGVILRTFATKEEDVEKRVKMVGETVKKIEAVEIDGQKIFSRVDILVWKNERFPDCDCGQTAMALAEALAEFPVVEIEEVKNFDLFCGILNYGIGKHLLKGISHSLIMSPDANSYLTPETINEIIKRFDEIGTMAVGLAITELTQSIKEGRLANTFLMWNNLSFVTIGGFDFLAKKLTPQEEEKFKAIGIKRIQGVEEVIPLARLVQEFGPCFAVVVPEGGGEYILPTDPDLLERHLNKMASKKERQDGLLSQAGFDTEILKGGVMP